MPVIRAADAVHFTLGDASFTGLAAPRRGSRENAVWRVRLTSTEPGAVHSLDHEEVLVALGGRAVATLDGADHEVAAGDCLIVASGLPFALRCAEPSDGAAPAFEAIAVLPAGATACLAGGEPFTPPWAQ